MNNLLSLPNEINMTSLEIAELTGKQHSNVCRDIRNQLEQQQLDQFTFESIFLDSYNREQKCYSLDYDQTMILISGYSIPLRAKIIKRWTELEKQNKPALPNSFAESLKLAYEQQLVIEQKEAQLKLQAPKVELAETCLRSDKEMSITDAGKHLGLRQSEIFKIMRDNGYLTKKNVPTQKALDRNILSVKTGENNEQTWKQAVMTLDNIMEFQKRHLGGLNETV